jgi:phospholipase C
VFHVYDRLHLERGPRRYTVGAGRSIADTFDAGRYDLWVLGPNGFHRHFVGDAARPEPSLFVSCQPDLPAVTLALHGGVAGEAQLTANAYVAPAPATLWRPAVAPGEVPQFRWRLEASHGWYDLSLRVPGDPTYLRRLAGRLETGADSISDPAMGGPAVMDQA